MIPHTEDKPLASNANPRAALLFFEEVEEDAADPLPVPLPDVPLPLPVPCGVVEGLAVGACDATMQECQIGYQVQEPKLRILTAGSFDLKSSALRKDLGLSCIKEHDLIACPNTECHIGHSKRLQN